MAFCAERTKWDEKPKFTPLSDTTSIPAPFTWESPRLHQPQPEKRADISRCHHLIPFRNSRLMVLVLLINLLKICFIQLEALHRSWWWYLTSMEFLQTFLRHWFSYHLRNVSGKPRWRVSGTRVLGSFQQNVSGSSGTSEKFVLFFWTEYSKRNFVFHLFRSSLIPGSLLHSRFSVNGTGLVKWVTLFDEEFFLIWILCNICPNRDLTGLTM